MAVGGGKFLDVTARLGEKILAEKNITGEVTKVDMTMDGFRGCSTCTWTEYDVKVTYRHSGDGGEYTVIKTYDYMSQIIKGLEEIAEEWWD